MRTGVLVAIAAGLIGLGLLLGLSPGSAMGATKSFSCGSPWSPDTKEMDHQRYIDDLANSMAGSKVWSTDYRERCDDAFGGRGVFGGVLAGLGALALVGVAVVRRPDAQAAEVVEPTES
jgi:hypothetical protein